MKTTPIMYTISSLLIILVSLFCKNANTTEVTSSGTEEILSDSLAPDTFGEPTKLAVLVGINNYKSTNISDLDGCINDVEMMKATLIGKFGFQEENILVLKDTAATHAGIVNAIQKHLIDRAKPNDIVVFHYSGHGSQMTDSSGDLGDETDGMDETIVPVDSRTAGVFDISDDEINGLLSRLSKKTKNITFILDSCHSGTAAKGSGQARRIPRDERTPPPAPDYALSERGTSQGDNDVRMANIDYVLISGCLSKQNSFEHYADGAEHGALTYFLTGELNKSKGGVTYRDIIGNVRGKVQTAYPNQTPQFEGTQLDQFVFSDSSSISQPYILVSPTGTKNVKVQAGNVHGLTKGSVFHVYAPDTRIFPDTTSAIAAFILTDVGPFESAGKITRGTVTTKNSRAIESQHSYPDLKLRVYYKGLANSTTLKSIKNSLNAYKFISPVDTESGYQVLLAERNGKIVIEGAEANMLSEPVAVNQANVVNMMTNKVLKWARWHNILAIEKKSVTPAIEMTLSKPNDTGTDPNAIPTYIEVGAGDQYAVNVQNKSGKDLYISIIDISTDGSISVIYPFQEGASELLKANTDLTKEFETFVPDGRNSVTDIIKVFATSVPIDFHTLTQPMIKGNPKPAVTSSSDPLTLLLNQAVLDMSRGSAPANVQQGTWETAQGMVAISR